MAAGDLVALGLLVGLEGVVEAEGRVGKSLLLRLQGHAFEIIALCLVYVFVDELDAPVILAKQVVFNFVDRAEDDLFGFVEFYELKEGDLLVESTDFRSKGPLLILLVLEGRLFIHEPFEYPLPHLALLVQKSQKVIPGNGVLNQGLRDALLDVRGRAALEGRDELCDRIDGELLLGVAIDHPRLLEALIDGEEVVGGEVEGVEGVLEDYFPISLHTLLSTQSYIIINIIS